MHNVSYFILRNNAIDPNHATMIKLIEVTENRGYKERPMQILDDRVKHLHNKSVLLVRTL